MKIVIPPESRTVGIPAGIKGKNLRRRGGRPQAQRAPDVHGGPAGPYIGNIVYGGLDGIVTTFAVISGVAGAELDSGVILILGAANLFADGVSMAIGAYLSSKSEREYYERERSTEAWEIERYPDAERAELRKLYQDHGFRNHEARALVEVQTRQPESWLDAMMIEEHGLIKPETDLVRRALATFAAFVVAGSVPLIAYFAGYVMPSSTGVAFPLSLILSALALFGLGAAKVLVTERHAVRSGLEMLLVGGFAAAVAYLVGFALKGLGS